MDNLEREIKNEVHLCAKCGREIPFGTSYYSISRQLEFFCEDPDTEEVEIEVEEAEEIISLCKSCGSVFNQESLAIILENLPIPGQDLRN